MLATLIVCGSVLALCSTAYVSGGSYAICCIWYGCFRVLLVVLSVCVEICSRVDRRRGGLDDTGRCLLVWTSRLS